MANNRITALSSNAALEKLTYMEKGKTEGFYKMWSSFLTVTKDLNGQTAACDGFVMACC